MLSLMGQRQVPNRLSIKSSSSTTDFCQEPLCHMSNLVAQGHHENPGKLLHAAAEGPENEGNQRHNVLDADSIGGTKCASAQILWYLGHPNPALLNRQGVGGNDCPPKNGQWT